MEQNFHIERVKRQTFRERLRAVTNISPITLFNLFYVLFGFTITTSLFVAAFLSFTIHREYLTMLYVVAPASTAAWGIAYGAWSDSLRVAWATLTGLATLGMIAGIFVMLTPAHVSNFALMQELIIGAFAPPALWAITFGLKKVFS
jgi:hypothetical protein